MNLLARVKVRTALLQRCLFMSSSNSLKSGLQNVDDSDSEEYRKLCLIIEQLKLRLQSNMIDITHRR